MKNNTRTMADGKSPDHQRGALPREMETLCSDAIERIAVVLGVMVDFDDPEPALVAAGERTANDVRGACKDRGSEPRALRGTPRLAATGCDRPRHAATGRGAGN